MSTANPVQSRYQGMGSVAGEETRHEMWAHWPVNWSAVWVGALAAVAVGLIFGLAGIALGFHLLGPENRVVDLTKLKMATLAMSTFGAFLSFAVGGWVAGKIAGILHSEPAMLHGAIVWLVAVPVLMLLGALGAGSLFGGWYGGLAGSPAGSAPAAVPFERPQAPSATASPAERSRFTAEEAEYSQKVKQWHEDTPRVARNSALGAITALLLGLMGAVIGGWMASGEPMTFTHYRTRSSAKM